MAESDYVSNSAPSGFDRGAAHSDVFKATIVTINGKRFVSALFWQPLTSPRTYMSEARAIGKKNGWDVVAIRRTERRIQAGFVSKEAGAMKGMYSLASALTGQLGDHWLGAFEVGDGKYAVVAIDEGSVVPGFDVIVGRDDALEKLQQAVNLGVFDEAQIYAPADFAFASQERDIRQLLAPRNLKRKHKLKPLTFGLTLRELAALAFACFAAVLMFIGFQQWNAYQERLVREERIRKELARQEELARLNANTLAKQTVAALAHPWAKMPSSMDKITACSNTLLGNPLIVGGWMFKSAKCGEAGVEVRYKRLDGTTVASFRDAAFTAFPESPVTLKEGGEEFQVDQSWSARYTGDVAIEPLDDLMTRIQSVFQSMELIGSGEEGKTGLRIAESQVVLPAIVEPPPGEPAPPRPLPDWKQFGFEYTSRLGPRHYFKQLQDLNGIRVLEITVTLEGAGELHWHVKGEIYGK